MTRLCPLLALLAIPALAQVNPTPQNLNFEEGQPGEVPIGWHLPKATAGYNAKLTPTKSKSGKYCAEIDWANAEKPSPFGNLMQSIDAVPYRGKRLRFRAAVRVDPLQPNVQAQLWFRVDRADKTTGFFDNMVDRPIHSPTWDYYDITGDIDPDASLINFGVMSFGRGTVYIDDVSLDVLPTVPAYMVPANASFERLTAAAKLWVYIKYLHTRVTAPGVDWDRAFVDAVPRILESKNPTEFAAALDGMLSALHDPATHVLTPPRPPMRIVPTAQPGAPGVHVVVFKPGTYAQAMAAANSLPQELGYKPSVVFDLRGTPANGWLPDSAFAFGAAWTAPPTTSRVHWGYAPQTPGAAYQGYYSAWETRDGQSHLGGPSNAIAPVFLVDRDTVIPESALAAQSAGIGAIVSEEPLNEQEPVTTNVPVGNLTVAVRTREIAYPDGTTGVLPNVVLNQTGDAALQAAIEIAKSGKWPAPPPRPKLTLPPAVFTEKQYTPNTPPPNCECSQPPASGASSTTSIPTNICMAKIGTPS